MNIIITMAGEGARFREIGIDVPKHMIEVNGRSLFLWSLSSLQNFFSHQFIFVTRKSHATRTYIERECEKLGVTRIKILELDALTSGQAESALLAKELIGNTAASTLIYNIDTYVEPEQLVPAHIKGDGWIPVFKAEGDRWSFCTFDASGKVSQVTEKKRISEFGTIGLYYFSSFDLFEECYHRSDHAAYPERFVAPLYNHLLRDSRYSVYADVVPSEAVHVLGTPEDVSAFCPEFGK
ncbi:MAG: hypothetical protein J0M12_00155 [Deltaproteobacteria bacterium]|nr:hypothetical protein [Deltaproteobacteria bacterium]